MSLDDQIIQRAIIICDCFTTSQQVPDEDYSLINISCVALYMSAKYDNKVPGLDFYEFFAYISRVHSYRVLLSFWDLHSSDIEWPELVFNRIEQALFESFPRYQINMISPIEVCHDLVGYFVGRVPEWELSSELLQEAALNTYLCMSGK